MIPTQPTSDLVQVLQQILQSSIAPVVLISGAGLVLLSMTNRLSRPIDRIRLLCAQLKERPPQQGEDIKRQIEILLRRCGYLQAAIILATASITCVSVLVLALFLVYTAGLDLVGLIQGLFIAALSSLILSLGFFLRDIALGLHSVKIEIETALRSTAQH